MNTRRLNITLPKSEADRIRNLPNKSAFIAQAVREKLEAEEKVRREDELARAYRNACQEEAGIIADWDSVAGDSL